MERVIGYTESFFLSAMQFISECAAKRKEILDAAKDTADDTELPDIEALVEDALFFGPDEDGLCFNLTDKGLCPCPISAFSWKPCSMASPQIP